MSLLQISKEDDYYIDLMKRFGPKDTTYAILWDEKDTPFINLNNIFDECEKIWNDHKVKINGLEPVAISKADDIVTFPGLSYCMQLILGIQTTAFRYMCVGSGVDTVSPFQQTLISEAATRGDMSSTGTQTKSGSTILRFANTFASGFATITVTESGVNTVSTPNTGILLNRNVFSSTPITHVSGVAPFTIASDITFTAVTTWG